MNRIVVGLGRSDSARRALRWAAQRASDSKAELRVVTAVADPAPVNPLSACRVPFVGQKARTRRTSLWQAEVVESVLAGMPVRPPVSAEVGIGRPDKVLREQSSGADLLVLGASERRFRKTIRRCLVSAACPVVVIAFDQPE